MFACYIYEPIYELTLQNKWKTIFVVIRDNENPRKESENETRLLERYNLKEMPFCREMKIRIFYKYFLKSEHHVEILHFPWVIRPCNII